MKRRLATRGGILLPALLALAMYAGCGGDAEVSVVRPNTSPDVAGVVELPAGVASNSDGFLWRFASLIIARAEALVGVVPAPNAPVEVTRYTQDDILNNDTIGSVVIGSTVTNQDGRYQVPLGNDIIDDCGGGRILVSTSLAGLTRAFAFSDEQDITVDAASEAMVRLIVNAVKNQGADLGTASNADLQQLLAAIVQATADVGGATVSQINTNAFIAAAEDPEVVGLLDEFFEIGPPTPTPPHTNTPTATHTPTIAGGNTSTPTPSSTLTHTGVATPTNTPVATPTNTGEATPTNTGEATPTDTNTPEVSPTNTNTPEVTPTHTSLPTDTPTLPVPADTPTNTPVNSNTPTIPLPTNTPTSTLTSVATPTNTTGGNVPNVSIGSATGEAGGMATIGLSLTKNGPTINVIAPLQFSFDDTRLTFGSCVSTVAGKNPTVQVTGNVIGVAISGTEEVFPDGNFLNCTFNIKAAATGVAPITFISAGMADQDFNDYSATGTSGQITIGGAPPTDTPTVAVSTPTSTATVAVPTPTETSPPAPPTNTNTVAVPATNTPTVQAPATNTPTTAPNSPTPTTGANVPNVSIGSATGAAGSMVTVGLALTKNGPTINVIAPLQFSFDNTRLAFGMCTSTVTGKNPTVQVTGNVIGVAISGTEDAFPDGNFLNCTFTINQGATGVAPLTFISAGMADQDFNDYSATGTSGQVTIGGEGPANTPTVAAPTATQVPPTNTVAVPTATSTSAPPTATQVPPTATQVPATSTATVAAATPTATTPAISGPFVTIASVSGVPGAVANVGISLTKNGPTINVIAPLQFSFDDSRLTFGMCTSTVTGKNPTVQVTGTTIGIAISGTEDPFPDGQILNCTFTVKEGANGIAPLNFISAGMADQDFNDYTGAGISGQVTIS